ncbi:MAG: response regulator [Vicinamibacterales bacterium]|nr:response regulator [Vicinamibacterales bacterium]
MPSAAIPVRALICAPSAVVLASITAVLERGGFTVSSHHVTGVAQLSEAIRAQPWDLVIVGHEPPELDGLAVLDAVAAELPVIVVSHVFDGTLVAAAMRAGARDCVTTDRLERLAAVVRRELDVAACRRAGQRTHTALAASEARHARLVARSRDLIVSLDASGRCVAANPAAERLLGYPTGELLQLRLRDLVAATDEAAAARIESGAYEGDLALTFVARSGRAVPVDVAVIPVGQGGARAGTLIVARDLSERHELEAQLRQAQKMEAIGRLVGGVAHDFNNLLTAITGHTDLLRERLEPVHPLRRNADEIGHAAARAARLVGQLLAFSRQQVLRPAVHDLGEIVADLATLLGQVIGEEVELEVVRHAGSCTALVDRTQIEQVLMNLAVNAKDAMPAGGRLTLTTGTVLVDGRVSRPRGLSDGAYARIIVRDTGAGMDSATMARAFEPFFTTKAAGKGTGLGLSTVHGVITQSGGGVDLVSAPGQGTSFTIWLPYVAPEETHVGASASPAGPGATPFRQGAERVLLVEDEAGVRELMRECLVRCGYEVIEAAHGAEALAMAERDAGAVDLLLTDLVMPQLGGRELAERLRTRYPGLRVLYVSGYAEGSLVDTSPPGTRFLQKPFTPRSLTDTIRDILDAPRS